MVRLEVRRWYDVVAVLKFGGAVSVADFDRYPGTPARH